MPGRTGPSRQNTPYLILIEIVRTVLKIHLLALLPTTYKTQFKYGFYSVVPKERSREAIFALWLHPT
jgi:hypothetical protein